MNIGHIGGFNYSNYSFHNFSHTQKEKTFSKKAFSNQFVDEDEVNLALQTKLPTLTFNQELMQTIFLQLFPKEMQDHVLSFFDHKNLWTCLHVCKDFNRIVKPLFLKLSLTTYKQDFQWFVADIDLKLKNIKIPNVGSINGKEVTAISASFNEKEAEKDIKNVEAVSNRIASFKSYCAFLSQDTNGNRDGLKTVLKSIIKLQKACQSYIENQKKLNNTQIYMQPQITRVNKIATSILFKPLSWG